MRVEDILEELNLTMVAEHKEAAAIIPQTETEAALLNLLSAEPMHVDELRQHTGLPVAQVSSTLALMELKGLVVMQQNMMVTLAHRARTQIK
jgi:DNA processing protein